MEHHDGPDIGLGQLTRLHSLGHRTDLVHFEKEAVAGIRPEMAVNVYTRSLFILCLFTQQI